MKPPSLLHWVVLAIALITVVSGLVQALAPSFILGLVGGEPAPGNRHSFAIVGMFMVLFGGLLSHALLSSRHHPLPVLWSGFQKLGAAGAVGLGAAKGLFGSIALLVAGFDLLSGILVLVYWRSIRRSA